MIKLTAKLDRVTFPRGATKLVGGFAIAKFKPVTIEEGDVEIDESYGNFSLKGDMPPARVGQELVISMEEGDRHPQFGITYEVAFVKQDIKIDKTDKKSIASFLKAFATEKQTKSLMETFDNPIDVIDSANVEELVKAKGVGIATAERLIEAYNSTKDYSFAFVELGKYDIDSKTIQKIVNHYKSPELAVEKIKENPYQLIKIDGYAFKKCDKLFLQMGGDPKSDIRILSFLVYYLKNEVSMGNTWIPIKELFDATLQYVPQTNKAAIAAVIKDDKQFFINAQQRRISLLHYVQEELETAKHLTRLMKSENKLEFNGWEEHIVKAEQSQGWSFTDQQKEAVEAMLENNVFLLEGLAGSGKSTSVKTVLDILENNGYLYAQCALSGQASSNLALITGREGFTIHRLLGINPMTGKFMHDESNKLPFDIIIVDEFSMVDMYLFNCLLKAMRSGSKLIMIGDSEQLSPIGVPVMRPMIDSNIVPRMMLTEIHRQAKKSAIVTHSIEHRYGRNPISNETGEFIYGELEDLVYNIVNDDDEIFDKVVGQFYSAIKTHDIKDIQVLSATKSSGKASCLEINKACQRLYNPESDLRQSVEVGAKDMQYTLREGDKVINFKTNYKAEDEEGKNRPIFNGSSGIISHFVDGKNGQYMVVDFDGIGEVVIPSADYRNINLGYCVTFHKAQGMGVSIVIIALPFHYLLNSRNLLYTAGTRAKQKSYINAKYKTIKSTLAKSEISNKQTYFADFMVKLNKAS